MPFATTRWAKALWVRGTVAVVVSTAVCLTLSACAPKQPAPLSAPPAQVNLNHYSGTPLSGPLPVAVEPGSADKSAPITVTLIALREAPAGKLEPLAAHARLIAATRGGVPVLPSGLLSTHGTRFGTGASAQALLEDVHDEPSATEAVLTTKSTVLPRGVTAVVEVTDPNAPLSPEGTRRGLSIAIYRPESSSAASSDIAQLAIIVQDMVRPPEPDKSDQAIDAAEAKEAKKDSKKEKTEEKPASPVVITPPAKPIFQREIALLDDIPLSDHTVAAVLVPFQFTGSAAKTIVAIIEMSPSAADPADIAHQDAFTQCVEDLKRSADLMSNQSKLASGAASQWTGFERALAAAGSGSTRRAALVYLAGQTGARLAEDIALVADDATLQIFYERVSTRGGSTTQPSAQSADSLGWILDLTSLELLGEMLAANKLPPELAAVLSRHAGEAGRHAASMEEILRGLGSRPDLMKRLVAENFVYLEDSSPASRVRAYDWLASRQSAPAGYDPLGSVKERREALEKALTDLAAVTAAATQPAAAAAEGSVP